jgi:ribonuclease HII
MKPYFTDKHEMGLDEAGRGPLIGPVYAACVVWGDVKEIPDSIRITDSKKTTQKQRDTAYEWITANVEAYGIGFADEKEIDQINILQATRLAMKRAIEAIPEEKRHKRLIIDGCRWEGKFDGYEVHSVVKGDATYLSIAAASILAKVEHDRAIKRLCTELPELVDKYDLLNNMGYGTKKHIEGLKKYGYSNSHRHTFKLKALDIYKS